MCLLELHLPDHKISWWINFTGAGSISDEVAKELAEKEYEEFNQKRLNTPEKDDFDVYLEEHEWTHKK